VNLPILEACVATGVTVLVIARDVTVRTAAEEPAEAVMSAVEAAAQMGAVKLRTTKAANVCASESPRRTATQVTSTHVAATKSGTTMSAAESTAHVAATGESAATMSTAKSAAHVAAAEPGRKGVCSNRYTERDGGEKDHGLARDGLLLDEGR
jgi:hypothetical protein